MLETCAILVFLLFVTSLKYANKLQTDPWLKKNNFHWRTKSIVLKNLCMIQWRNTCEHQQKWCLHCWIIWFLSLIFSLKYSWTDGHFENEHLVSKIANVTCDLCRILLVYILQTPLRYVGLAQIPFLTSNKAKFRITDYDLIKLVSFDFASKSVFFSHTIFFFQVQKIIFFSCNFRT